MPRTRRHLVGLVVLLALVAGVAPAGAQPRPPEPVEPDGLTAADGGVVADGAPVEGDKSTSRTIAETDPDLLARTDGEVVPVMIKLDYDAIASYAGGRPGLAATSPSETGDALTGADVRSSPYARQVARDEAAIVADIEAAVPSIEIGQSLRIVYGGVAAHVPASAVESLLAVDGVLAVQSDEPNQLLTDSSPSFVGADQVWSQVGGQATAGRGVIFGTLDSGVWPEHPQLADTGVTGTPPAKADGTPRRCDFGDNPLTPATDVFACNDKLISGQAFTETYHAQVGDDVYQGTARDSNGHGTHTSTTAAGNPVASAVVQGIERGPISGLAPGAWVAAYKVCGPAGCYGSDTAAAVQQAILDGVDVINFSISGGRQPATDPTELAFLDAYAAGVFVAASAGNSGPGADTADHHGPWVTTVAATSPNRDWATTLTLSGGAGLELPGLSLTGAGATTPLPVVLASAPPYSNAQCTSPAPPGLFTGRIVACERSPGRVTKGFNLEQGGAAGMIIYNATPNNVAADPHWLPTVHVDDGPALLAHLAANPGATASFARGVATPATGDEIAVFSSRGPGGLTIKPDVGAPGQQVLAGQTPTPESVNGGPAGEYYRANDGTSMAAPHVAGAAILLRDAHPDWTPGQVRSALTGSASPTVTSGGAPATPFDTGSGRIQVDDAVVPGLLLDETAARFAALGIDPVDAVHLNLAQVSAPVMPGRLRTTRTVQNPGAPATYTVATTVGADSTVTVEPATFTLGTGETQELEIMIESSAAVGTQVFGGITITASGRPDTRLPVAFVAQPSEISLTGLGCTPDPIEAPETSTCSFELVNEGSTDALVDLRAEGDAVATVTGADLGATVAGGVAAADDVPVAGYEPGVPHTAPAAGFGYIALDTVGGTVSAPIGDEAFLNYNVPAFVFGDQTYDQVGVGSNGYIKLGGGTSADQECCDLTAIGDPAAPNDVLAPYWTDLDGTGAPGVMINVLTDGVDDWIVVEWRVNLFGTSSRKVFQTWIGANGTEDITFSYHPTTLADTPPAAYGLLVGAENRLGAGTTTIEAGTAPTGDLRVTSGAATDGATVQWDVEVQGTAGGTAAIEVEATSDAHPGTVVATNDLVVEAEPLPVVTTDPEDTDAEALDTATFTAAATGGTLARWERLPAGGSTWATIVGATSTTLSFTAHGDDDGAQYRAVFANSTGGETTTAGAELTVDQLPTSTELTVSPADPVRGQDVTLTADIDPATAGGTVQFSIDGDDVGPPVALSGGRAVSAPIPDLPFGGHTARAEYSGDVDHEDSDDDDQFEVDRNATTTVVVDVDPDTIFVGDDVLVDVDVSPAPAGGTVRIALDGTDTGAPITVDPVTGEGTATLVGVGAGDHTVSAGFSGDADLDGSFSATVPFTVAKRTTTTELSIDPANPVRGQDITVTAGVGPASATGTVQFAVDGADEGAPVALAAGEAEITLSDLSAGDHEITATYSGDDGHLASDDDLDITVLRNASTTTIVEITSGVVGVDTPVEATITVVPAPSGGTVGITVDGVPYGAPLTLDGTGSVDTTLTGLAPGSRTIVARFSGDDDLDPSDDEVTFTVYAAGEAFVRRAYQVMLGRNGDATGIAYWTGQVDTGLDRSALIERLSRSAEGRGRVVGRLFLTALDRPASATDKSYWGGRLARDMTAEDLMAYLLASNEGIINAGRTPEGFVEKLFDAHLDRAPSASELTYWGDRARSTENIAQVRQLAKRFGRVTEAGVIAIRRAGLLVCGVTSVPGGTSIVLHDRWIAQGRDPVRLDGETLALLCPSSSAPPS